MRVLCVVRCDGRIPRPEKSYQLWCVIVCTLETSRNKAALARIGLLRQTKKGTDENRTGRMNCILLPFKATSREAEFEFGFTDRN